MQISLKEKMIFIHIPRTGGSWFSYNWPFADRLDLWIKQNGLGRHGKFSNLTKKLDHLGFDYTGFKTVTIVREPMDRIASSWVWFSKVKGTAEKHGWKTIDDMLDEYESGTVRANYMPQTFWLCDKDTKFDFIYRFEDLLKNPLIVKKDFPTFGNTEHNSKRLTRQGQIRTSLLSLKQKERIKIIYKDDFEFLSKYYQEIK